MTSPRFWLALGVALVGCHAAGPATSPRPGAPVTPSSAAPSASSAPGDMPAILVRIMSPPNGHARGGYPPCPPLSAEMKRGVAAEIKANPGIESSLEKLDPAHELEPEGMQKWFEGIRELDQAHAAFGLTVAVCHPHDDVKIAALKVLPGIHELGPVAYLLDVTKSFAVFEAGSENATMHGIVQHDLCDALNLLVNANVKLAYGQDPNGLSAGIPIWRTALASKTP